MSDAVTAETPAWIRQQTIWTAVELLARGRHLPAPVSLEWHLTTVCNLACPQCISRRSLNGPAFTAPRALALAREFAAMGVRAVALSGGGEPLCHPRVAEVALLLAKNSVEVGLVTNGVLLQRHEAALAEACQFVRVSLDAACPATHERLRPRAAAAGGSFGEILRNVESLTRRGGCCVEIAFVVFADAPAGGSAGWSNVGEIAAAARLARALGCSGFEVQLALDQDFGLVGVAPEVRAVLAAELEAARALADERFLIHEGPLVSWVLGAAAPVVDFTKPYVRCPVARLRSLVTPRGAFLCPYHSDPRARYGDPNEESFAALWGSAAFRRAWRSVDPSRHCNFACMSDPVNRMLADAIARFRRTGERPPIGPDRNLFV
jgi:hypothetical protein